MSEKEFEHLPDEQEGRLINRLAELIAEKVKSKQASEEKADIDGAVLPKTFVEAKNGTETSIQARRLIQQAEGRQRESQKLRIKRMAEERFFKVGLNITTPQYGIIDVHIERKELRLAILVFVNLQATCSIPECFQAGYSLIILYVAERKDMAAVSDLIDGLPQGDAEKVRVLDAKGFVRYLDEITVREKTRVETINGRKVTTEFIPIPAEEAQNRVDTIKRILYSNT